MDSRVEELHASVAGAHNDERLLGVESGHFEVADDSALSYDVDDDISAAIADVYPVVESFTVTESVRVDVEDRVTWIGALRRSEDSLRGIGGVSVGVDGEQTCLCGVSDKRDFDIGKFLRIGEFLNVRGTGAGDAVRNRAGAAGTYVAVVNLPHATAESTGDR